jgi:lipopolysaccharide transport system ATP-binding protein
MPDIAISVQNLGKKYILSHQGRSGEKRYVALRDVIMEAASAPFRKLTSYFKSQRSGLSSSAISRLPASTRSEDFWAVKDVSFEIKSGQAVGIIGRNGAGKSTLLKLLSRITAPTTGRMELNGRVASLLEVGTGFHPELTGRENIYLNGAILGMHRAEIKRKFDEIVTFAEVERFLDTPVKRYSSGMYMRLAFAVAAHLEPEILIVDEVLAVGDSAFQKKCLGKMSEVSSEGRTVLFVSHNMDAIMRLCSRAILLQKGSIIDTGSARDVVNRYSTDHAEQPVRIPFSDFVPVQHTRRNIFLCSAEWTNREAKTPWAVPYGTPIEFDIVFECKSPVRHVELGIALYAPSGSEIASTSSIVKLPDAHVSPGRHYFRVNYGAFNLVPNSYMFGVGLKSDSGMEDHYPRAFSIDVVPSEESSLTKADTFWGYVVPPATYELSQC